MIQISFILNGKKVKLETDENRRLIDILREDFSLTGTKEGCSIGECGACTIIMNKLAVNSCLVLAGQLIDSEILTIEGVSENGKLNVLQENFLKYGAVQCGYCTPGMIMSIYALLLKNNNPADEEIKEAIAGNLCRCTGYKQIIDAARATADTDMITDLSQ
ncbi:MAG: (2Fe-2S)-binding protein [Melioribacteraceae bacterium]|nr:(2Fe-2S)-binding protein [Melioribacteraceae bacterium]